MKLQETPVPSVEWLTLAMLAGNYLLWFGLLILHQDYPLVSVPLLGLCLAMHLSLQHELIHGHPTRITWFNDLLGTPPISLVYPYAEYKRSHLEHHKDEQLTTPGVDPESFFHTREHWNRMGPLSKALWWANMTLLGRLLINPVRSAVNMAVLCARQLLGGTPIQRLNWTGHILGVAAVLWLVHSVFSVPIWAYLIAAHMGHALISMRSFYEHRVANDPMKRIVVVESCRFFQILFLNNNFHAVHHRYPGLPWYRLKARFHRERDDTLERNGEFYYSGYLKWLRFLVRPVAPPVYPALLAGPDT